MKRKKAERLLASFLGWEGVPLADRPALENYLLEKVGDCGGSWSWESMTRPELQASVDLVDPGIYVGEEPITIEEEIERRLADEKRARLTD